jgi:hypothetical protein
MIATNTIATGTAMLTIMVATSMAWETHLSENLYFDLRHKITLPQREMRPPLRFAAESYAAWNRGLSRALVNSGRAIASLHST